MGAKLRARLPKGNGFTAELAEEYADHPGQVVVIALLDVDQIVTHVSDEDSRTTVFEILALEPFKGKPGEKLQELLRKEHENRTGQASLFDSDNDPEERDDDDAPEVGKSVGDPAEYEKALADFRREKALGLREQAEQVDDKAEAKLLEEQADAFETGARDEELDRELRPQFLAAEGE